MKTRSGFTMIELIFVIVILGILAAVALPKFVGAGNEAHVANLKSFEGTLNRTVAPTAWAKVASQGGSLKNLPSSDQMLSVYTEIPQEFGSNSDNNLTDTVTNGSNADTSKTDIISGKNIPDNCKILKNFDAKIGNANYSVCAVDGTSVTAPKFHIYKN